MSIIENEAVLHVQEHLGIPHYKSLYMVVPFLECVFENSGNEEIKNCPRCQNFYSLSLFYGSGVLMDKAKGLELLKTAARQGYAKSIYNLARMYEEGDGMDVDLKKAYELCKAAADKNYPDALQGLTRISKKYHSSLQLDKVEDILDGK